MKRLAMAGLLTLALGAGEARAAKIQVSDEAFVDVKGFLQAWGQVTEDGAPDGESTGKELFVRRARLILTGQLTEDVGFIVATDTSNIGKLGNHAATVTIQDAFGSIRLVPGFLAADVGLFLPPFLHHGTQGAASVVGLDLHAPVFKYAAGSSGWRDAGAQLRGGVFEDRVQFRLAAFNGVRGEPPYEPPPGSVQFVEVVRNPRNQSDALRYTGSLRVNLLEPEPDFYFQGINLGKRKVLSVGIAGDTQKDAAVSATGTVGEYRAYGADVYLDLPLAEDREVVFQAMASRWWNGEGAPATGVGSFVEGGYRLGTWAPYASWVRFFSDAGNGDTEAYHLGLTHYIRGHALDVKADVALERAEAPVGPSFENAPWRTVGTLGLQLYL